MNLTPTPSCLKVFQVNGSNAAWKCIPTNPPANFSSQLGTVIQNALPHYPYLAKLAPFLFPTLIFIIVSYSIYSLVILIIKIKHFYNQTRSESVLLEVKSPHDSRHSSFATEQLYATLHSIGSHLSNIDRLAKRKKIYSLELVSTKKEGIRYLIRTNPLDAEVIRRNLIAYNPGTSIQEVRDYFPSNYHELDSKDLKWDILEFTQENHFALPLQGQTLLEEYDPISYLATHMTKLTDEEVVSMQIVLTPLLVSTHPQESELLHTLEHYIENGVDIMGDLKNRKRGIVSAVIFMPLQLVINVLSFIIFTPIDFFIPHNSLPPRRELSPKQKQIQEMVEGKIGKELFETSVRLFVVQKNSQGYNARVKGFLSFLSSFSYESYQGFVIQKNTLLHNLTILKKFTFLKAKARLLSIANNPILSVAEISSLYHFPYGNGSKSEDVTKVLSPDLPTPLSVKNTDFDVVFGKNMYGNIETPTGLTDDDRSRHVYMLGQTGSGKTTIIFQMAKDDIQKGRGITVIDPHGDLAEDLLETVPLKRKDDLIYLNPFDLKYPIGINLLELTEGLDEDAMELEKELVTESVISIFRRVFSGEEKSNAHRIEYILRNAIYTSFTIPDRTIFTIYDLLNNPDYQRKVIKNITDENLQNFWKYELGRAGNYQIVKMVSGVTAKIGRFLFSPTAKRILEQPKSTINFDWILDSGKILICNLAEGKLGEDTSQLLGTMILAKIQQAAFRRSRMNIKVRKPFYLYIDEFQNFATSSFTKMLSGGRKFSLRITIAEQSTAQQDDRNVTNTILANTGTVICFRTASPIDEDLMLTQFRPLVEKGDIANLPRYHFYIKLAAIEPQDTFSGETLPIVLTRDQEKIESLIDASRKNWAILYKKKAVTKETPVVESKENKGKKAKKSNVLPDDK